MGHTRAWRNFRRMQDLGVALAALLYLAGSLQAWWTLPGRVELKALLLAGAPLLFGLMVILIGLGAPFVRRPLKAYVWASFKAGFGQTLGTVIVPLGILILAGGLIFYETARGASGGRYPAGIFSGFGAGMGILVVQAILCRRLERDPQVRAEIEEAV